MDLKTLALAKIVGGGASSRAGGGSVMMLDLDSMTPISNSTYTTAYELVDETLASTLTDMISMGGTVLFTKWVNNGDLTTFVTYHPFHIEVSYSENEVSINTACFEDVHASTVFGVYISSH